MESAPHAAREKHEAGTSGKDEAADETWAVCHLFLSTSSATDVDALDLAFKSCQAASHSVVTVALLGHRGDLAVMGLGPSFETLRALQNDVVRAGCTLLYSYVSRTEVSEYAKGIPKGAREARLHPVLPPKVMPAFCFYPMSKRRDETNNWYLLPYEERASLMAGHGRVGRTFAGRIVQLITGSTGLDDYEWGVTLFGRTPDDIKDCVYTMRFDEASARYADFGPFLYGTVGTPTEVFSLIGLR
jgi:chlorite dismutase